MEAASAGNSTTSGPVPSGAREKGKALPYAGYTCFFVMPYGREDQKHTSATPEQPVSTREHFDKVNGFLKATLGELGISPLRSDESAFSAPIHGEMITDIIDADLVVVDISSLNANVFYELGIRHTARPSGTVLIGDKDTKPPFNIAGVRMVTYDLNDTAAIERSKKDLKRAVDAALGVRVTDSLVHYLVPGLNLSRKQQPIRQRYTLKCNYTPSEGLARRHNLIAKKFTVGIITGDISRVDHVDVWVNPESTRMEMARVHDTSVSAFIRYHGAKKDKLGNVKKDLIRDELAEHFPSKAKRSGVEPGAVVATGPGDLEKQYVRRIFHVAAQHGEPCNGYRTIESYETCIGNALEKLDEINDSWSSLDTVIWPLKSIVFPLLGTRGREHLALETTTNLVHEALCYLDLWPETKLEEIYFLAWTRRDLELLIAAFKRLELRFEDGVEDKLRSHLMRGSGKFVNWSSGVSVSPPVTPPVTPHRA